jgi:hypothetical protein
LVKQFQRSQPKAFSLVVDLGTPPSSAERVTHDEVEKILRILATVSEAVWSRGLSNIRLTLIADQEHSIRFPADENDWVSWHRALSMARPHDQPLRLLASLKELIELDRARAASPAPVVVLSACSLADYVTRLQAIDDAPAAPPVTVSAQDWEMGSGGPTSEFWALQQSIRSWFTPGDSWLSSWYLDTVDQDPPEHGRGELQRSPGGPISATPDPTTTPLVGRQPRSLANGLPGAKSGVNSDVNSDAKSAANSGGNSDANSATGAAVTGRSDRSASESSAAVGVADWGSKEGTPQ